jgi:protein-S-isoprenylcysteine O-methyltransferase Ste14
MRQGEQDCPAVIARPPRLYLGFFVVGLALGYFWPALPLPGPSVARYAVGAGLIAAGVLIMAVAMRRFRRAGTNVETHKPTTALVTDGLFGYSRNPI